MPTLSRHEQPARGHSPSAVAETAGRGREAAGKQQRGPSAKKEGLPVTHTRRSRSPRRVNHAQPPRRRFSPRRANRRTSVVVQARTSSQQFPPRKQRSPSAGVQARTSRRCFSPRRSLRPSAGVQAPAFVGASSHEKAKQKSRCGGAGSYLSPVLQSKEINPTVSGGASSQPSAALFLPEKVKQKEQRRCRLTPPACTSVQEEQHGRQRGCSSSHLPPVLLRTEKATKKAAAADVVAIPAVKNNKDSGDIPSCSKMDAPKAHHVFPRQLRVKPYRKETSRLPRPLRESCSPRTRMPRFTLG